MDTSKVLVKMEHEIDVKVEFSEPNVESPVTFDGNIKFEVKTEPEIVDFDTSILTENHLFEDTDIDATSNCVGFDSKANSTDESVLSDTIVKEEPEFYDSCVGEFVPTSQLTALLKSNSVKKIKPFKCEQCSATFNQNFMLKQHIKIHKQMSKTPPSGNNARAFIRQRMKGPKRSHKVEQLFACLVCLKRFNSKSAFESHESMHTVGRSHRCDQCPRQFRLKHHLQQHIKKSHAKKAESSKNVNEIGVRESPSNDIDVLTVDDAIVKEEPAFYDPNIGEIVPSSQLANPIKSDIAIKKSNSVQNTPKVRKTQCKQYKCEQCSATFDQSSMLKQHIKIHKQLAAEVFVCSYCCRPFSTRQRLSCHERIHKGEQPYACLTCHKRFNSKLSLETHQTIHSGQKPFQCESCRQVFRLKQHLERHTCNIHTKKPKDAKIGPVPEELIGLKLFECYLCSERFQFNQAYLKLHFQSKHINGTVYECDFCAKLFLQKNSILTHLHRAHVHGTTKRHKCNVCDSQFNRIDDLKYHLKSHHEKTSQKFQCDFCPMLLSTRSIWRIHRKTHTGLKPYECEYCEKRFLKPGCLKRHTMTHTGERPFGCNICFQKFSRNHLLTDHKRNVHKIFGK